MRLLKYAWSGIVIAFGVGLLAWIGYNLFVEMQPPAEGRNPLIPALFGIGMIATGVWRIRHLSHAASTAPRSGARAPDHVASDTRVACKACGHSFTADPAVSFLGFRRYRCPACRRRFDHPMWPLARALYLVLLIAFLIEGARGLHAGEVVLPSLLVLLAAGALLRDRVLAFRLRPKS
jgi:hypothetical protein